MASAEPEVTVQITPRLRALLRGAPGDAAPAVAAPMVDMIDEASTPGAVDPEPSGGPVDRAAPDDAPGSAPRGGDAFAAEILPHARPIRLRRDGQRPLEIFGLPILRLQTETRLAEPDEASTEKTQGPLDAQATIVQRLDLYYETSGALAANVSLEVGGGFPARPQYHAARLATPGALAAFLDGHDPRNSLVHGAREGMSRDRISALGAMLTQAFRDMLQGSGLSLPGLEEGETWRRGA